MCGYIEDVVRFVFNRPASALVACVVSRIMHIVPQSKTNAFFALPWVFRFCRDKVGIVERVGGLAAENDVSFYAILQNPIEDAANVNFVVTTSPCK